VEDVPRSLSCPSDFAARFLFSHKPSSPLTQRFVSRPCSSGRYILYTVYLPPILPRRKSEDRLTFVPKTSCALFEYILSRTSTIFDRFLHHVRHRTLHVIADDETGLAWRACLQTVDGGGDGSCRTFVPCSCDVGFAAKDFDFCLVFGCIRRCQHLLTSPSCPTDTSSTT